MAGGDRIAQEELTRLESSGLRRSLEPLEGPQGPVVQARGRALINLSSNDYLGLASDASLARAAAEGAASGTGAGASRLVVGSLPLHARLEAALATFEDAEASVLFNSGYCANLGVLQSLVGPEDAVFSDALNHASLIDGARLSRAQVHVYPHLDLAALKAALAGTRARRKLVATDAVFSMDGDLAPLPPLCELAEQHGAMLVVDEAHATGVFGPNGRGLADAQGCAERVDVRVGTLSKAAGSFGAFAVASRSLCELLVNRARSYVFTTALPPAVCAASLRALEELRAPGRRARLWENVRQLAEGLRALGVDASPRSPIFPVVLGTPAAALAAAEGLRARGVLAKAIRPPTVPAGTSRLRLTVTAAHTPEHLKAALAALAEVLPGARH